MGLGYLDPGPGTSGSRYVSSVIQQPPDLAYPGPNKRDATIRDVNRKCGRASKDTGRQNSTGGWSRQEKGRDYRIRSIILPYSRRLFTAKCSRCARHLGTADLVMRAAHHVFHVDCFKCAACDR